jgi:hypothetical protein
MSIEEGCDLARAFRRSHHSELQGLEPEQRERNPTSDSAVPTTCASGEVEMVSDSEIERREPMLASSFVSGEPPISAPSRYGIAGPRGAVGALLYLALIGFVAAGTIGIFFGAFRPQGHQSSIQAPATLSAPTAMPRCGPRDCASFARNCGVWLGCNSRHSQAARPASIDRQLGAGLSAGSTRHRAVQPD